MTYQTPKYFLLALLGVSFAFAATPDTEKSQKELEALQKEIARYEQELSQKKANEKSTSNLIAGLDREIDVTSSLLFTLRKDLNQQEIQIKSRTQQLTELEEQIEKLRALIKKRLITFYKHGRRRDYEMLLTNGSWEKANIWLKYQKLVAHNDRRNFESLSEKVELLHSEQRQLNQDIAQKEQMLDEQERRTEQLKASRTKRQNVLQVIRKDRAYLEQHVQELENAQQRIRGLIESREKERTDKQRQISHKKESVIPRVTRDYSFANLRGHLPWPTNGNIISHFGKQRHPTLNTVTENLGIEIRAPLGTPVQSVDAGQVQTITWQRGRGNIIIISHDEGYYTVYTHLADIRVNVLDYVETGQVIGTVGDSGSLNGPVLHFQIWKNTDNLDPEDWLG
ncbi:peptidoglycan DD-metalloendopeptidase family protein [candidate division KSB1 bacterium]|nr:peptidoglycan DD-metalloendopeptidase family protein [candidate division KSB1 bacterium]